MTVWRLIAHWAEPEAVIAWSGREGRIAIGWSDAGDLRVKRYASPRDISKAVQERSPGLRNWPFSGIQLWDFYHSMNVGDLVILSGGGARGAVMRVTGEYEWVESGEAVPAWCPHQRRAELLPADPDAIWLVAGGCAPGHNIRWTLIRCRNPLEERRLPAVSIKNSRLKTEG